MTLQIVKVESRRDLKRFVTLPIELLSRYDAFVPPLIREDMELFDPKKNPAFETSEAALFLALQDGRPVGRIAAVLSHGANNKYKEKNLRFGWVDFIEDYDVFTALMEKAEEWGREKGMTSITGPQGFTDLDPMGTLVEGFDRLSTIATIYNPPYYPLFMERYGFTKRIDYVEFLTKIPDVSALPPKWLKTVDWVKDRYGLSLMKFDSMKKLADTRGMELFTLLDESFEDLYGTVPLTENQKRHYIKKYLPLVSLHYIQAVQNKEGVMVGFIITMPNLSEAFKKIKGRLLPFGFLRILKALKKPTTLDFYLAGVKTEYRNKGVDVMMTLEIARQAMAKGLVWAESNPELEDNKKVHNEWRFFNPTQHKRRRIYGKSL